MIITIQHLNISTSFNRIFNFTSQARNVIGDVISSKDFYIIVATPYRQSFSNIRTKLFLPLNQRKIWKDFITDDTIFPYDMIYRPMDTNFGIQMEMNMLIMAGIETTEADKYISAMGLNTKRKKFKFGGVKKAVAAIPGTKKYLYEVIYLDVFDPLEPNKLRLPHTMTYVGYKSALISADIGNYLWEGKINDLQVPNTYYPNSISNWRNNFEEWSDILDQDGFLINRNDLPLWMRTPQPDSVQELGFTLAIPICYCKVGTADDILLNIKNHLNTTTFKFNIFDFEIDRFIISAVEGYNKDKYLVFKNDGIII